MQFGRAAACVVYFVLLTVYPASPQANCRKVDKLKSLRNCRIRRCEHTYPILERLVGTAAFNAYIAASVFPYFEDLLRTAHCAFDLVKPAVCKPFAPPASEIGVFLSDKTHCGDFFSKRFDNFSHFYFLSSGTYIRSEYFLLVSS